MEVDEVADELYALPPEDFTAARDGFVKQVDDPTLKKTVKALRKPTASAYAVNRIVRDHPAELDDLLTVGQALRRAMAGGGGDLRELAEQRRELVSSLIPPDLPAGVRDDVTATLEAATADPELAAAVRSGRLVKPLRYAGFGTLPDLGDAVATPVKPPPARKQPAAKKTTARQPAARQPAARQPAARQQKAPPAPDLTAVRQRVLDLAGAADDAQRRYDEASRAVVEARRLLDAAEAERATAHKAAREAHAEAEKARRELGRLERS